LGIIKEIIKMETRVLGLTTSISPVFFKDLRLLLSLKKEEVVKLAKFTKSDAGFKVSEERIHEIFKDIKTVSITDLSSILNVGNYVYRLADDKDLAVEDIIADLRILAEELKIENFSEKQEAFKELFARNEAFSSERLKSIYQKVLPYYISGKIAWDVRPVFKKKSMEILTTLPVAILRLRIGSYSEEGKTFSLQLLESDIKELMEVLEHSKKELLAINNKLKIG
jgi:hypothetical protein